MFDSSLYIYHKKNFVYNLPHNVSQRKLGNIKKIQNLGRSLALFSVFFPEIKINRAKKLNKSIYQSFLFLANMTWLFLLCFIYFSWDCRCNFHWKKGWINLTLTDLLQYHFDIACKMFSVTQFLIT